MQKLLLELGGPLVFAFVLLAIAKFVRGLIERYKAPKANEGDDEAKDDRYPPPD
jgi:hypothetical protein